MYRAMILGNMLAREWTALVFMKQEFACMVRYMFFLSVYSSIQTMCMRVCIEFEWSASSTQCIHNYSIFRNIRVSGSLLLPSWCWRNQTVNGTFKLHTMLVFGNYARLLIFCIVCVNICRSSAFRKDAHVFNYPCQPYKWTYVWELGYFLCVNIVYFKVACIVLILSKPINIIAHIPNETVERVEVFFHSVAELWQCFSFLNFFTDMSNMQSWQ